jgi:hypothetical protein
MVIFGGWTPGSSAYSDITYQFNLSTNQWSILHGGSSAGTCPSGRESARAVYDPRTGTSNNPRMIVFGGLDATSERNDVWQFDLVSNSWTQLSPGGSGPPTARFGGTTVYDASTSTPRMLIHGGVTTSPSTSAFQDTWALSLGSSPSWSQLSNANNQKTHQAFCMDTTADQIVVFGWLNGSITQVNDTETFDTALGSSGTWQPNASVVTGTPPGLRYWMCSVWDTSNLRMVFWGGSDNLGALLNEVWEFE